MVEVKEVKLRINLSRTNTELIDRNMNLNWMLWTFLVPFLAFVVILEKYYNILINDSY